MPVSKESKRYSSTSGNGWGRITLELDKHTNIDAARFEASTIVRQTWPDLPEELSYPILEMSRPDDKESRPFMSYTLNASATPIFIQRFAEDQIKPRLSSVQGIYRIDVSGATPMEWRLEYDSRQLRDLGDHDRGYPIGDQPILQKRSSLEPLIWDKEIPARNGFVWR